MFNNLIGKNKELGRFLFCERYTLPPVKNAMYIAEGQELKRGAVVDVNGVLVGTNSLMPYAVLEFDCDTRSGGKEASVFIKGEFNFDKLYFADGLDQSDLDNIVYNGNGLGIVIKPYEYAEGFSPSMVPAGTSKNNPLMTAADTELMILEKTTPAAKTFRFAFSKLDYSPVVAGVGSGGTWTKVSKYAENNVWDWTKNGSNYNNEFTTAFTDSDNLVSLIAVGDTSGVVSLGSLFRGCTSLVSVCLFDTSSNVYMSSTFKGCTSLKSIPLFNTSATTNMYDMLRDCTSLESVPLFDTSVVTDMSNMLRDCPNVKDGALALYQQASTQATPPTTHANTFTNCGKDTETGAAELAQIPTSWGGTAPASLNMDAPQNLTEPLSPSVIEGDDSLTK